MIENRILVGEIITLPELGCGGESREDNSITLPDSGRGDKTRNENVSILSGSEHGIE